MAYKLPYTGEELKIKLSIPQPKNLLDNSNFTNLVNQRGITTTTAWAYCIDRWIARIADITLSYNTSGLKFSTTQTSNVFLIQKIAEAEQLKGKTVTLAACDEDNSIIVCSCTIPDAFEDSWTTLAWNSNKKILIGMFMSSGSLCVQIGRETGLADDITCKWAALYEGEYTADTLPEYQPKSYSAELEECQRYCNVIKYRVFSGYITSNALKFYSDTLPEVAHCRATPSVSMSGTIVVRTTTGYSTATGFTTATGGDVSLLNSVGVNGSYNSLVLTFADAVASQNNSPACVYFNGTLILNAEL